MRSRRQVVLVLAGSLAAATAFAAEPEGSIGAGTRVGNGSKVTTSIGNLVRGAEDVDDYVFDGTVGQSLSVTVAGKGELIPFVYLYRPDASVVMPADGAKMKPLPVPSLKPSQKPKITFQLDQTGVWTLRVLGARTSRQFQDDPGTPGNEGDDPSTEEVETKYVGFDYGERLTFDKNGDGYYDPGDDTFEDLDGDGVHEPNERTTGIYSLTVKLGAAPATTGKNLLPDEGGEYRFIVPGVGGGTFDSTFKWKGGGAPVFFSFKTPDGADVPGFAGSLTTTTKASTAKKYLFPATLPLGSYVLTYRANPATPATKPSFSATVKAPKGGASLKGELQAEEPIVTAVSPVEGGPGSRVTVTVTRLVDLNNSDGSPRVLLGRFPLTGNLVVTSTTITGNAPSNLPEGTFDVVVESTAGQAAVKPKTFKRVPPPDALALDPSVGTAAGGYYVTVTGTNFNPAMNGMRINFVNAADNSEAGEATEFDESVQTDTRLAFQVPANRFPGGVYRIRVTDNRTQLSDYVPMTLELSNTAAIARVFPGLTPVLGGETMFVQGSLFDVTAQIQLEDSIGSNTFTPVTTTWIDDRRLSFVAPARPQGTYRVRVLSLGFTTPTRPFAYFTFGNLTPALGLGGGADNWDGSSTAIADLDKDGDDDLVISRALTGVLTKQAAPQTRVLLNDGTGDLTDVTSGTTGVMPTPSNDDDWRADRVQATDVNSDGYPDLVITTNSKTVPAEAKSHTRFLINETRGTVATDRIFRDRTADFMPPPRTATSLSYGNPTITPDNWRGFDLWLGDLDLASGPPEMIITHDELKEDVYVGCTPYCASPYSGWYTYSFYWGGSRMFLWDKNARGGLGRYKFSHNFFPRKSGVTVAIFNPPPGVTIPTCTSGSCRGTFTPFAGQKLAVGSLDGDGKPDIAVVSKTQTLPGNVSLSTPLQVAVNKFTPGGGGSDITDLTAKIGADLGDAVAIGQTGFPDGNAYGVVAVAKAAAPSSGSALKLFKFKPSAVTDEVGDFEDITSKALPNPLPANDKFQSSAIRFVDIDQDGDQDMILVANAAPNGTEPAFRVLRNEVRLVNNVPSLGVFTESLKQLIVDLRDDAGDAFDGDVLSLGDLDGDDALDFVITRSAAGTGLQTRAVRTEK